MRFAHSSIAAVVAALVVVTAHSQAAATAAPLAVTEERNSAAVYALSEAQFMSSILITCAKLDASAEGRSRAAWDAWRSRNWPYVDASMGWVEYLRAAVATRQGQEAASIIEPTILANVNSNALKQLNAFLPDGKPEAEVCNRWIELASDPVSDVRNQRQFGGELEAILAFHRALIERAQPPQESQPLPATPSGQ